MPTEDAERSSEGIEDSAESKDGRLCPSAVCGDVSINDRLSVNGAQPFSEGNEEHLSSFE